MLVTRRDMHYRHLFYLCLLGTLCEHHVRSSSLVEHARKRRSALQFYALIQCHQHDVIVLARFGDYGCFCGVGGVGSTALDPTDGCCRAHDECYKRQDNSERHTWLDSLSMASCGHLCVPYSYTCENETITCKGDTALRQAICECDKEAANCFASARNTYDERLLNVDPKVWCNENANITELLREVATTTPAVTSSGMNRTTIEVVPEESELTGTTTEARPDTRSGTTAEVGSEKREQNGTTTRIRLKQLEPRGSAEQFAADWRNVTLQTTPTANSTYFEHGMAIPSEQTTDDPRGNGLVLRAEGKWIFTAFLSAYFLFHSDCSV